MGLVPLEERPHRAPSPLPTRETQKMAVCAPGSGLSPDAEFAGSLILDFQPPEL